MELLQRELLRAFFCLPDRAYQAQICKNLDLTDVVPNCFQNSKQKAPTKGKWCTGDGITDMGVTYL